MPIIIDPFRGLIEVAADEKQRATSHGDKTVLVQEWIETMTEQERKDMVERAWKAIKQISFL